MVEILGPLPARLPTPPRPVSRVDQNDPQSPHLLQTPEASSQTADASRAPPSSHGSKRVNFSPWLYTVIGSPKSTSASKLQEAKSTADTTFESPRGSEGRPFKSILKETSSPIPVWSPNVNKFTTESLDMLLESVVQQLAGESVASRLDAYINFFNALRTYDGLLGGKEIGEKLPLITDFIQRDVSRDLVNGTPMDTSLANQALKLSNAFVWQPDISKQLSEDFKVFLVERAITSLQETKGSKSVLTHYLSILSDQNFSPKIMTTSRVTRLLTALQDLSKHVNGKSISFYRLKIYQRLLSQSKSTFLSQSSLWVENLVHGLLDPHKDTRAKAISLGWEISVAAGPTPSLSNNIRMLFDRPLKGNGRMAPEICERMSRMVASVDGGIHVPQIWSIVVLLLRRKKWNLDQWEHFKGWLLVLQKCLNCSDLAIKSQAITSWNRFVYAVSPNESTSRSMLRMLGRPVFSQFERKKSDKSGSLPFEVVLGSYYYLLYYAFRPSLPHHHLDIVWEEYVASPSAAIFSAFPALSNSAALVLANLLWCPQAKVWTETRITNTAKMEVEELPSVDPRWIRSKISSVLGVFESLLKSSVWNQVEIAKSNIALAWNGLTSALSLASSKEITPSGETMQAVASVLGLLHRLWATGPSSLNAVGNQDAFFERFRFLSTTMILSLGGISFTEKLMLKTGEGAFQASTTPKNRPTTSGTNLNSPILHLLRTISKTTVISSPIPSYIQLVDGLITASCNGRISRGSRLELLHQCAELSVTKAMSAPSVPHLLEVVWKGTACATADALQSFPIESARERNGSVSRDYEIITKILKAGMSFPGAAQEWSRLLDAYVRVVRTEKGDHVLTGLVVEPIADFLSSISVADAYLPTSALLGHCLSIPFTRETGLGIDQPVAQQGASPTFPDKLLETVGRTLDLGYYSFSASHSLHLSTFIESLTSFLGSGSPWFRSEALKTLQAPLVLWIKDAEDKFNVTRGVDSRVLTACLALLSAVINILQTTLVHMSLSSLDTFDTIVCAGLESAHISTSARFVDLWNAARTASDTIVFSVETVHAFNHATSRLSALVQLPQNTIPHATSVPSSSHNLDNQQVNEQIPAKGIENGSTNFSSTLVVGKNYTALPDPAELSEPQLPTNSEAIEAEAPATFQKSRREMFRMVESIRSSSPANTPGKLGFDTPSHLRRLHARSGIPLTPTLAPAENEEAFIGSSPTPATRDPTPAMNLESPGAKFHDVTMDDTTDLPSSPPEFNSRSPSPNKLSSSSRRARRRKLLQEEIKRKALATHVDERPPSCRTRSALIQSTASDQNTDAGPAPTAGPDTPVKAAEKLSAPQSAWSKSSSKKRKKKAASKAADRASHQPSQAPSTPVTQEYFVDSSSEDLESQIASQLEQDLGFAVDMIGKDDSQAVHDVAAQEVANKKRKREPENVEPTTQERRRSTRLSTKDMGVTEVEETQPTQPQDASASQPSQNVSASSVSPMTTRRSTRNSQKKDGELVIADTVPETQIQDGIQEEPAQNSEPSQRPTKRSRKSLRLEDQPAPPMEDQSLTHPKTSRSSRSRSRKSHSSRSQTQSELSPSQEQQPEVETATKETELLLLPASNDNGHADSGSTAAEKRVEHVPLVSTEEATDSQMTDVDSSTPAVPEGTDRPQNMAVDMVPDQPSTIVAGPALDVATAAVQTEPAPPNVEPDTSESGISRSLRKILADMKSAILGPSALREVDDLLFNIRVEAHDASRRNNN